MFDFKAESTSYSGKPQILNYCCLLSRSTVVVDQEQEAEPRERQALHPGRV
jgi:hypothetical protein